ncbi:hypothetical protein SME05J_02320 [Serratia marcescens]|nr:hypothetical protein SME05J_02320 [Serratia marcescens]
MMIFTLPKPLPDSDRAFSWLIVGGFSAWGGIVRYLMENKASGRKFSWREIFTQVVISGFTGFLAGVYGYEQGYSEFMTMVFSGLGGALGGHLLDVLWRRLFNCPEKESNSKR